MVAQLGQGSFDALIGLAAPLAARSGRELLVTVLVDDADRLGEAARQLNERRDELLRDGVAVRSASFTSGHAGADIVRLARSRTPTCCSSRRRPTCSTTRMWCDSRGGAVRRRDHGRPAGRGPCPGRVLRGGARLGGDRARRVAGARPGMPLLLAGSTGDGAADATRAGCSPTRRSRCSARSVSRPSRCSWPPIRLARGSRGRRGPGGGRPLASLAAGGARPGRAPRSSRAGRRDAPRAPRSAPWRPRAGGARDQVHLDDRAAGDLTRRPGRRRRAPAGRRIGAGAPQSADRRVSGRRRGSGALGGTTVGRVPCRRGARVSRAPRPGDCGRAGGADGVSSRSEASVLRNRARPAPRSPRIASRDCSRASTEL